MARSSSHLQTTEAANARHTADRRKAAEIAQRFAGWSVWSSRDSKARIATRTGCQHPPEPLGDWAQTLTADDWDDLVRQLQEQDAPA